MAIAKYDKKEDVGIEYQTYVGIVVNGAVDLLGTLTGLVMGLPVKAIGVSGKLAKGGMKLTADFIHGLDQILYAALEEDGGGTRYDGFTEIGYRCMSEAELSHHLNSMDDKQVLAKYGDNTKNLLENVQRKELKALISDTGNVESILFASMEFLNERFEKTVIYTKKEK